jgi:hypothetical protein
LSKADAKISALNLINQIFFRFFLEKVSFIWKSSHLKIHMELSISRQRANIGFSGFPTTLQDFLLF